MPPIESSVAVLILWAVLGYGLGSVPFGMVLARVMNLGNLREIGSVNIGATNVLRTGSKTAAALTLIFDAGKGAVAVLLARAFAGTSRGWSADEIAGLLDSPHVFAVNAPNAVALGRVAADERRPTMHENTKRTPREEIHG